MRGNTLQQKIERLEDLLFADLQTYLGAMNSTPNQHQDQIKSLMETLEHLLQRHLEGCEGWNSSCFIDGIVPAFDMLPDCISIAGGEMRIQGTADWCGESGAWIEPFYATMRLSAMGGALSDYTLCFGDSARGLATVPYGKHLRRTDWFYPSAWLFTFTKGH